MRLEDGVIVCDKRDNDAVGLVLQHDAGVAGEITLQTCLLPDRDEPYVLELELARHRLMVLYTKREDWGMFDLEPDHPVVRWTGEARELFTQALSLQHDDPQAAADLARRSLAASLDGTEELALLHSGLLMNRRVASATPAPAIGLGLDPGGASERVGQVITAACDFVEIAMPWRRLCPQESGYDWEATDRWVEWARSKRVPIVAGPLLCFEPDQVPDWLYIWEHDYDTVRDLVYEHIEAVVSRYGESIGGWKVVSGLHVNHHFSFNFEQLMDLTRMAVMVTKKACPTAKVFVDLRQPFGEYYADNARSIPPMTYADLVTQANMGFDGFSLHLPMGQAVAGQYTRDLMQISSLLDGFATVGKPLFVSVACPSDPVTQVMIRAAAGQPADDNSGRWRQAWSESVQSHWLEAVVQIAASKPYIEAVSWAALTDHPQMELPLSGLVTEDLSTKPALKRLAALRRFFRGAAKAPEPPHISAPPRDGKRLDESGVHAAVT